MTHTVIIPERLKITPEQFTQIAIANRDLRLEQTVTGELIIMPPTGGNTGKRNSTLNARFVLWNEQTQLGEVFDSSTAFRLPNGAARSPDIAWVRRDRWDALTPAQQETFPPLCPDFVLKLRSKTDSLSDLQAKMQEYLANGLQLGWLINIQGKTVEIYRAAQPMEQRDRPDTLDGEAVLSQFTLELGSIWDN
ncbi:Uma2 family endonuclease [Spirulina major CS-329]|uniref:Uma2 family endonuclease n=1 Tax=Spirulina TaxID=1154 RepID=UPI00232F5E44|nr:MULTISPECIES: Uma2 family endonuclease [Spirulina]MDB9493796.1 Uma2 family endonuclease [Spirulina subsalsa CS-330]MDB9505055.1 Uma2 family endonuclease [Spirulina major CS-329]